MERAGSGASTKTATKLPAWACGRWGSGEKATMKIRQRRRFIEACGVGVSAEEWGTAAWLQTATQLPAAGFSGRCGRCGGSGGRRAGLRCPLRDCLRILV